MAVQKKKRPTADELIPRGLKTRLIDTEELIPIRRRMVIAKLPLPVQEHGAKLLSKEPGTTGIVIELDESAKLRAAEIHKAFVVGFRTMARLLRPGAPVTVETLRTPAALLFWLQAVKTRKGKA